MTSIPLVAVIAICVGLGALAGPRRSWRSGVAVALAGVLVALLLVLLPGLSASVARPAALLLAGAAALCAGATLRAAIELSWPVRGAWIAWLPVLGATVTAAWQVAPVLLVRGPEPTIALAAVTVGSEQQTRDLLLPLVQPLPSWVAWGWGAVAVVTALLLRRGARWGTAALSASWLVFAAAVAALTLPESPTQEAAEALARAALHPGEKVLGLQPLPTGPFVLEPNFYAALLLLVLSGIAVTSLGTARPDGEASGEPAARGLVAALLSFALLASAQLAVGLPMPTMHGMAGVLVASALCFAGALFGQAGSARIAARLLVSLVLLFPWLLWGSFGARS